MTSPLTTLTDRDLLMNLYVGLMMAIEMTDIDADASEQQILLADARPPVTDHIATLGEIMAEVESRLEIQGMEFNASSEALH